MNNKRIHVVIEGRVQGVFFRAETQETARRNHLTGWVRNLPGGQVEAVFEGRAENIDHMMAWCHEGPPLATVTKVDLTREDYRNEFSTFSISY
ncbi:MAG: acylphosphatase [Deltaproteobacteria bacterium]|nr:acylphosphatase [Deltaproteobacteria bacterium]